MAHQWFIFGNFLH